MIIFFFHLVCGLHLAIITVSKNGEHVGNEPVLIILVLSTSIMLLSPLFLDIMLFIYRKVLKRRKGKQNKKWVKK